MNAEEISNRIKEYLWGGPWPAERLIAVLGAFFLLSFFCMCDEHARWNSDPSLVVMKRGERLENVGRRILGRSTSRPEYPEVLLREEHHDQCAALEQHKIWYLLGILAAPVLGPFAWRIWIDLKSREGRTITPEQRAGYEKGKAEAEELKRRSARAEALEDEARRAAAQGDAATAETLRQRAQGIRDDIRTGEYKE